MINTLIKNGADGTLSRDMWSLCGKVGFFASDLRKKLAEVTLADQAASHDEVLPDAILAETKERELDHIETALILAGLDCQNSLRELKNALGRVAGLSKGEMRDKTEERLRRAVQGAEVLASEFAAIRDSYEPPKRPHEIRRNGLSFLIAEAQGVTDCFAWLLERVNQHASADLIEEIKQCESAWAKLARRFVTLRERSSQKMEQNLEECFEELNTIFERLKVAEREAAERSGDTFMRRMYFNAPATLKRPVGEKGLCHV